MLSGSTLLRVVVLFVVAAALAGLVQAFWPHGADDPAPAPQIPRTDPAGVGAPGKPEIADRSGMVGSDRGRSEPAGPDLPRSDPGKPETGRPDAPSPLRDAAPAPSPPASDSVAAPSAPGVPQSEAYPSPIRPLPRRPAPDDTLAASPPSNPAATAAQDAIDSAGPRAVSVVDLNTGSLAELNALKGGGLIGRAIVQRRPYTSVDQLLSKRVLSRSTYDRIKDQVTVR